jgi:hypothetical protein
VAFERIGEAELDERLTRDADALGFLIDGLEQIDRKVDVHALDLAPWAPRLRPVEVLVDLI